MKKITILSLHLGYGGIEKCVANLANMLVNFYDVEIVCSYKILEIPAFYIDSRVHIKYLMDEVPNKKEFKMMLKSHKYLSAIKEAFKGSRVLYKRRKTMINYIINSDSDVIISTRDIFDDYLGIYGKKDVLKIGWEHNHYHDNMKYAENVVRSSSNLDYLVLVSDNLNKFYKEKLKSSKCKTVFIPNVVEYIPDIHDISKLDSKRLVSVGRLSKEKGFLDLLKIFSVVSHDFPDWNLDIVGDGDEREKLEKYIRDNDLTNRVKLHGFRDKDYIYSLLSKSSVYLMTSYTESFGIVLLEAMSSGVPCVVFSSAEGANEIITSGKDGYLIKNRNFSAYIKKCEDLMTDKEKRVKIGMEGRKTVMKYSSEVVSKKWLDLIDRK